MTGHEHDKHLDELLDSALSQYSAVEPGPGLETRIQATVREARRAAASPQWNWRWLWAGAVALAAILLIALLAGKRSVVPAPGNDLAQKKEPAAHPRPESAKAAPRDSGNDAAHPRPKHLKQQPEAVALKAEPRRPVFPSPAPLSEQEKLLLSYYSNTPREELIAQSRPEDPPVAVDDQSSIPVPELILVPQKSRNTR